MVNDAFKTQSVAECDVEKDWATVQGGVGMAVCTLAIGLKYAPFGGPAVATVLEKVFEAACLASVPHPPVGGPGREASLSACTSDSMLAPCWLAGYEQPAQLQAPDDPGEGMRGGAARRPRVGAPGIERQARRAHRGAAGWSGVC